MSDGEWPRPEDFFDEPKEDATEAGDPDSTAEPAPARRAARETTERPTGPSMRAREVSQFGSAASASGTAFSAPPVRHSAGGHASPRDRPSPPIDPLPQAPIAPSTPPPTGASTAIRPSESARQHAMAADLSPVPLVPRGGVFEGQIAVVGETRIEGQVNGTLKGPGTLILEPHARVEGIIDCDGIECQGQVMGPVAVRHRARFYGAARLDGDLAAPAVEVQDAALWVGDAKIGR